MICPSKVCKAEIPDDSCYCDQCGLQLSKCDKCGAIGASKRCGKCGGFMVQIQSVIAPVTSSGNSGVSAPNNTGVASSGTNNTSQNPPVTPINTAATAATIQPSFGATMILSAEKQFELVHTEGWSLELADGNIFGRVTGNYISQLSRFNTISSRHAQVSKNNNKWFITDLGSTNGTIINGQRLTPNSPVEITENDTVVFADVTFTVRAK